MREREGRLTAAYRAAGAGPDAAEAVPAAIQAAIDALVAAHQTNVDLSGEERIDAFRSEMLRRCPQTVENPALAAEIEHAICESASWEPPDLIAGAVDAVAALRRAGLRTAVVSNTGLAPGAYVEAALRERALGPLIDHWIWSDEVRSWKPGQAIFRAALDALGVSASEAAFVGDTPEADVLGAQQAGFATVVQVGAKRVEGVTADLQLESVAELPAALAVRRGDAGGDSDICWGL